MSQGALHHRSGRLISLARLSLAGLFLAAVWADPGERWSHPSALFIVLAGYVAVSATYLAATWADWWLEHRLARWAHGCDIAMFGTTVYLTEGYASPFFLFFVFPILAARIRWGWKQTAATAAMVAVVFLAAAVSATPPEELRSEITRLIVRSAYLVVLSLLFIWFSFNQRTGLQRHLGRQRAASAEPPIREGLEEATARTGARRAALLWWDEEEPWVHLATLEKRVLAEHRCSPGEFGEIVDERLAGRTFLFDAATARALADNDGRSESVEDIGDALDPRLRARLGCEQGLAVPFATDTHGGLFVLGGIRGLCADDLQIGKALSEDFAAALQQSTMLGMFAAAAANRTRLAIARDLHDTIVQLLAGTAMRLQGIRHAIAAGRDVDADLKTLQEALAIEQQGLRALIEELRSSPGSEETMTLAEGLIGASKQAARQWGVKAELEDYPGDARIGKRIGHEINQLVREAIANAARHGQASKVALVAAKADKALTLAFTDNGIGFADAGEEDAVPRSMEGRVHALGGTLDVQSSPTGSTVTIRLPWDWTR